MSYVRASILGTAPMGEVWSVNPVFDPTFEFPGSVDQTALDSACDAIAALNPGSTLRGLMSISVAVTGARLEVRHDTDDSLIAISQQVRASVFPGTGTPLRGAQDALVFSLRTNTPGASGRGRLYWPALATGLGADTRVSLTDQTNALTDMRTYLNAMRSALASAFPGVTFDLAVRSKTTSSTPHVNKLQVGNVLDTQRRRRDAAIEDYALLAFPS